MPCYSPLTGYYARKVNKTGKRSIVFDVTKALIESPVLIPCGRCIGCRLDRSRDWAVRCMHEASLYDENSFITLTFDDDHVKRSLDPSDFQKFMKRLRSAIAPKKVRYFACGEYGSQFSRPHHHACLFGYDFPDKELISVSNGVKQYTSELLSDLWPMGLHTIGSVTFDSAAYVARYVLKKWKSEDLDEEDLYNAMRLYDKAKRAGVKVPEKATPSKKASFAFYDGRLPEYVTMSLKPGIAEEWFSKFSTDIYPNGFVVLPGGKSVKPPKFYDRKFEIEDPRASAILKGKRLDKASKNIHNSKRRLAVREAVKLSNINQLQRSYEYGS